MAFAYAVFAQFLSLEVAALLEKKESLHLCHFNRAGKIGHVELR